MIILTFIFLQSSFDLTIKIKVRLLGLIGISLAQILKEPKTCLLFLFLFLLFLQHTHRGGHTHTERVGHLEGLEAESNIVSLRHSDPPHTFFGGSVVIWVVGRLNLA